DWSVTGVQTCALPIFLPLCEQVWRDPAADLDFCLRPPRDEDQRLLDPIVVTFVGAAEIVETRPERVSGNDSYRRRAARVSASARSEERRVGKRGRARA